MSKPAPPSYRTTNWRAYCAALKQRGSLLVWFDPEMEWLASPLGRRGRPATFSDAAIQTCLTLKVLFGLPLRQTQGLVASLLALAKLDWPVPDFSTLCRRQKGLLVQIPYRPSTGALHLLIDSTGIKAAGEGEWSTRKHGASRPRSWRKVHLGIDADTMEVRAIEITGSRIGDGPMLPELLAQIPAEEPIGLVTADGAYDIRPCHAAIAARQAKAVRRGSDPPDRTLTLLTPDQAQWSSLEGDHARRPSSKRDPPCHPPAGPITLEIIERHSPTKSHRGKDAMPQAASSERLMARTFDRQTTELHIRAALLNHFTRLGTAETQRVA